MTSLSHLKLFLFETVQNEGWSTGVVHGPGVHVLYTSRLLFQFVLVANAVVTFHLSIYYDATPGYGYVRFDPTTQQIFFGTLNPFTFLSVPLKNDSYQSILLTALLKYRLGHNFLNWEPFFFVVILF